MVQRPNGATATALSEGERNAIALIYFLRSMEADGVEPNRAIVVVDDPVTSLDRDAMFAVLTLLRRRTESAAQTIVLTHDFECFRLWLGLIKTPLSRAANPQRAAAEALRPSGAVLEFIPTIVDEERRGRLRPLPASVLTTPSEYHFLFDAVARCVITNDAAILPLMGNAARRLVDGFTMFHAPDEGDFTRRVESLQARSGAEIATLQRLVKFMHGHSHLEEARMSSGLNFPGMREELVGVLRFMRAVDPDHVGRMCSAVGSAVGIDEGELFAEAGIDRSSAA